MPGKDTRLASACIVNRDASPESSGKRSPMRSHTSIRRRDELKSASHKSIADDSTHEENGALFWVNKSGFPIDTNTWERMWDHAAKIHPDSYRMVHQIRQCKELPLVAVKPPPVNFPPTMSFPDRLEKIQQYMSDLQYNHTGTQLFEIRKGRTISGLMECAKEMIRESLPIKCLEAVVLGLYLSNGLVGVERFPISFKSLWNGFTFGHVVLGLSYGGKYGALGMSRRTDLMYKPVVYKSLSELILDYETCYNKYFHEVKKVKIGLPVAHDPHSYDFIKWKGCVLNMTKMTRKDIIRELDTFAKDMLKKAKWNSVSTNPKKMSSFIHVDLKDTHNGSSSPMHLPRRLSTSKSMCFDGSPSKRREKISLDMDYQIRI